MSAISSVSDLLLGDSLVYKLASLHTVTFLTLVQM